MLPRLNDCSSRTCRTGGCASPDAGPSSSKLASATARNEPQMRDTVPSQPSNRVENDIRLRVRRRIALNAAILALRSLDPTRLQLAVHSLCPTHQREWCRSLRRQKRPRERIQLLEPQREGDLSGRVLRGDAVLSP